jgi:hypothetical protein
VQELKTKLEMAAGNLQKAKRFYCGTGPQAREYEQKTKRFRNAIMAKMGQTLSANQKNS